MKSQENILNNNRIYRRTKKGVLTNIYNHCKNRRKVNIFDDEMLKAVKEDIKDNNYKILSILTHEQFSSLEYII